MAKICLYAPGYGFFLIERIPMPDVLNFTNLTVRELKRIPYGVSYTFLYEVRGIPYAFRIRRVKQCNSYVLREDLTEALEEIL